MSDLERLMEKYPINEKFTDYDLRNVKYKDILNATSKPKRWQYKNVLLNDIDYPRHNQKNTGTCTSCATSFVTSYILKCQKIIDEMTSVNWFNVHRDGVYKELRGLSPRETLKTACKIGCIQWKDFSGYADYPLVERQLNDLDINRLNKIASEHKFEAYVELDSDEVNEWLNRQKTPLLIVLKAYENFYDALTNGGEFPSEGVGNCIGSHTIALVGSMNGYKYMANSWGETGDKNKLFRIKEDSDTILFIGGFMDIETVKPFLPSSKTVNKWEKVEKPHPAGTQVKWKWIKEDGSYARNEWIKTNNKWYYIGDDQYCYDNNWLLWKGSWYFFLKDSCAMATNYWCYWKNKWYYLNSDGIMETNKIIDGKYYVDSNGVWDNITR